MKEININTFDFPKVIKNNYLYVDKTEYVWKLVKPESGEYFLSRPRRFGKSLLVSTLKAVFQGRRELFKGLAIDSLEYDWTPYPVIHLDFGDAGVDTARELEEQIASMLEDVAEDNQIQLRGKGVVIQFKNLIRDLAKANGGKVVVLVDEYDKPILSNVTSKAAPALLKKLKRFYSVIKTLEKNIRFAFITGVSKFSHVSLFSDLNNLTDITLRTGFAGMLGFTETEIRKAFADRIPLAAEANGVSPEELMARLLQWYDGYRFSEGETHVCNPVSLSSFFSNDYKFSNYWDSTGMPSFLLKVARDKHYNYEEALTRFYDESVFSAYELDKLDVTGLLWQTGYYTIKEARQGRTGMRYRLGFPDFEVLETFNKRLLEFYGNVAKGTEDSLIDSFADAIEADDLAGFMKLFQSFLASISYDIHLPYEKYYQTIFFVVFKLIGATIEAESRTNEGRIDAYIRTAKNVYLFEFKLDRTATMALDQIQEHHYYEKFQNSTLPITMVGVNFNSEKGRIDEWKETRLAR